MVNALSNIESSFDNIKSVTDEKFVWKPGWFLNQLHHPQGIAVTKDKYYISHNGIYEGYIYVFDRKTSEALPGEWKTVGGAGYNHPGTIQIANHLLLATLQQRDVSRLSGYICDTPRLKSLGRKSVYTA